MKQPTEEIYKAAIARLENGYSLGDVIRYFGQHPLEYDIPKTTLHRRWEKHRNSKTGTPEQQTGTGGTTALQNALQAAETTPQGAVLSVANADSEHSEQAEQRSVRGRTAAFFQRHFSLMHLVFYTTTGTGCFAIWNALPNVLGACLLSVFALFSMDSLLKAQNGENPRIAEYGRNRVIASECVASVFHYLLLNKYLWENTASLPFEIRYLPPVREAVLLDLDGKMTNGYWQNGDVIFYLSIGIAGLLFVAAFAAVDSILQENKK